MGFLTGFPLNAGNVIFLTTFLTQLPSAVPAYSRVAMVTDDTEPEPSMVTRVEIRALESPEPYLLKQAVILPLLLRTTRVMSDRVRVFLEGFAASASSPLSPPAFFLSMAARSAAASFLPPVSVFSAFLWSLLSTFAASAVFSPAFSV